MEDKSDAMMIKNLNQKLFLFVFIDRIKGEKKKGSTATQINLGSKFRVKKKKISEGSGAQL